MRLIEANPKITQREMAAELGISIGATHYMLRALVERGLLTASRFSASRNKQAYAYMLTPRGVAEKTAIAARCLVRKREEYEALRLEIEQLGAELAGDSAQGEPAAGSRPALRSDRKD
ncbi:MarR family EPS-associated transcriptional regulator [Erythrobacter sp. NFXS35]